jgi:hypothetical protein
MGPTGSSSRPATRAPTAPDDGQADLTVSIVLVAGLSLVHVLMAYNVATLPDRVFDLVNGIAGREAGLLAAQTFALWPLAVVVLLHSRTLPRGALAFVVVVAASLAPYARDLVDRRVHSTGFLDASGWVVTALLPTGAALGWSLARRSGARWWPGLISAPTVAVGMKLLDLDVLRDDPSLRAAYLALVYHVVPAVLAGLLCWWLATRGRHASARHRKDTR